MRRLDEAIVVAMLAAFVLLFAVFAAVGRRRTQAQRLDSLGGTVLLGRWVMESVYWVMQATAAALVRAGVTANGVTWMSLGTGAVAGTFLALGYPGLATLFGTISALGDSLDGLVSRATGTASDAGEVLDTAVDLYTQFFFLAGFAIFFRTNALLLGVTLAATAGSFIVTYTTAKAETFGMKVPSGLMRRHERAAYMLVGAGLSGLSIPLVEPHLGITPGIGIPAIAALVIIALFSNRASVIRFAYLIRALERRDAAAAEPLSSPTPDREPEPVGGGR